MIYRVNGVIAQRGRSLISTIALLCLFLFLLLSQEIGWEERLRNDLFCVI